MPDSLPPKSQPKKASHLQDASQLVVEAIISITDIVESMHNRIGPITNTIQGPDKERTAGLTGLVYKSIRSVTSLVGKSIDGPLGIISDALGKPGDNSKYKPLISALNGVLGDHLVKRNSTLAVPMRIMHNSQLCNPILVGKSLEHTQGKLIIMVHGLCMDDEQWLQDGHDHGKALANDLEQTVVYLHYNTGQHISDNGKDANELLEQLVTQLISNNSETELHISIVAHSMGGLVARSAVHQGQLANYKWSHFIRNMIFLGTPHHGAPLEKLGNWLDMLVGMHNYSSPLKGLLNVRSAGITDLRHGNVMESDWHARGRFDFCADKRTPLPLPSAVNCYTVASTAFASQNSLNEQLIGDGLVPLDSALGRHENKAFTLQFPVDHQWIGRDINHRELLSNADVYQVIRRWLST